MSDDRILTLGLLASGLIPFTLAGGWGPIGDHSFLPWTVGFGTQAGFVIGVIGYRRGRLVEKRVLHPLDCSRRVSPY